MFAALGVYSTSLVKLVDVLLSTVSVVIYASLIPMV